MSKFKFTPKGTIQSTGAIMAKPSFDEIGDFLVAGEDFTTLVESFAADGKVTFSDFLNNIPLELKIGPDVQEALKDAGTIKFADLTTDQAKDIGGRATSALIRLIVAIKKFIPAPVPPKP